MDSVDGNWPGTTGLDTARDASSLFLYKAPIPDDDCSLFAATSQYEIQTRHPAQGNLSGLLHSLASNINSSFAPCACGHYVRIVSCSTNMFQTWLHQSKIFESERRDAMVRLLVSWNHFTREFSFRPQGCAALK